MINKNKLLGFTLVELMVTVVIVAILSSIAVPSYRDYVIRSQAIEGMSAISDMRVKLEQFFQDNRTYTGACKANTLAPLPTNLKYFTISCDNLSDNTYTITATSDNFIYTNDQANNKQTTKVPNGWATTSGCWVISKSGECQ